MLLQEELVAPEEETILLKDVQEVQEVEKLAWVKLVVLTHAFLNPQHNTSN